MLTAMGWPLIRVRARNGMDGPMRMRGCFSAEAPKSVICLSGVPPLFFLGLSFSRVPVKPVNKTGWFPRWFHMMIADWLQTACLLVMARVIGSLIMHRPFDNTVRHRYRDLRKSKVPRPPTRLLTHKLDIKLPPNFYIFRKFYG